MVSLLQWSNFQFSWFVRNFRISNFVTRGEKRSFCKQRGSVEWSARELCAVNKREPDGNLTTNVEFGRRGETTSFHLFADFPFHYEFPLDFLHHQPMSSISSCRCTVLTFKCVRSASWSTLCHAQAKASAGKVRSQWIWEVLVFVVFVYSSYRAGV